jgi:hypothetical protein
MTNGCGQVSTDVMWTPAHAPPAVLPTTYTSTFPDPTPQDLHSGKEPAEALGVVGVLQH